MAQWQLQIPLDIGRTYLGWIYGLICAVGMGKTMPMYYLPQSRNWLLRCSVIVTWFYCDGRSESRTTDPRCIFGSILRHFDERIGRNCLPELLGYLNKFRSEEKSKAKSEVGQLFIGFIAKICAAFEKMLLLMAPMKHHRLNNFHSIWSTLRQPLPHWYTYLFRPGRRHRLSACFAARSAYPLPKTWYWMTWKHI